jgi:hypothetical protein
LKGKGTITHIELFDTPAHLALEAALKDYYYWWKYCKRLKSKNSAFMARKALQKVKTLAHTRKLELLSLYSVDPKRKYVNNTQNKEKQDENIQIKSGQGSNEGRKEDEQEKR